MQISEENAVNVLTLPLFRLGMDSALKICTAHATSELGGYACFVNVHSLIESLRNPGTAAAIRGATFSFPDGLPLVWASHLESHPIEERVSGPDFMAALLSARPGDAFGFIGGKPGQAEEIGKRFGIQVIAYAPPFRAFSVANAHEDWKNFLQIARGAHGKIPRYVWVCLGAPKQELWMQAVCDGGPGVFFFGVGAAIDFLTGEKARAPAWMQKSGMEWFFRFLQEPGRLWRRYLKSNSLFAWLLLKHLFSKILPR